MARKAKPPEGMLTKFPPDIKHTASICLNFSFQTDKEKEKENKTFRLAGLYIDVITGHVKYGFYHCADSSEQGVKPVDKLASAAELLLEYMKQEKAIAVDYTVENNDDEDKVTLTLAELTTIVANQTNATLGGGIIINGGTVTINM
ncbi:MAG: hypothetical protein OXR68_08175 [Alphaproteobacteria bacterium]|nr:hypothetical protein [Alphaproteobacteria bacterium]MDD9920582.1 hypothetical protein [Alphaproteobacteria bacterium]